MAPNSPQPAILVPPKLVPGDLVALTSPAGHVPLEAIQSMVQTLRRWGLTVRIGATLGQREGTFGGSDAARAADLQQFMDDPDIKAIYCARGGYGCVRIVDQLDLQGLRRHPKWVIGFSDITVLHSHLHQQLGLATLHAPMAAAYTSGSTNAATAAALDSIRQALLGEPLDYALPPHPRNREGEAVGRLVGGNLRTLETLAGSASALHCEGRILFLEDVNEALYSVDRMFWHLQRSGALARLVGLVVGGFSLKPTSADSLPFSLDLYDIVSEKTADYDYPVCFDFPVGHQPDNLALKCGVVHRLSVNRHSCRLTEA